MSDCPCKKANIPAPSSAAPRDALQESLAALLVRTRKTFKVAHVLQHADGTYLSLDFNLPAKDKDSLCECVLSALDKLGEKEILPAADESFWKAFAGGEIVDHFNRVTDSAARGMLLFAVRRIAG